MEPICCSTFLIRLLCSSTCAGAVAGSSAAPRRPTTDLPTELPDAVRPTGALVAAAGPREDDAASAPTARLAAPPPTLADELAELAVDPAESGLVARVSRVEVVRDEAGTRFVTPPLIVLELGGRRTVDGGVGRLAVAAPAGGSAALRLGPRLVEAAKGRVVEAADVGRKPGAGGMDGTGPEDAVGALMGEDVGRGSIVGSREVGAWQGGGSTTRTTGRDRSDESMTCEHATR